MRCGKMLKDEVAEYCEDCAKRKSYITQGRSLWLHQKPVSDALYRFKYHNKRCYGSVFSEKLAEKYRALVLDEIKRRDANFYGQWCESEDQCG